MVAVPAGWRSNTECERMERDVCVVLTAALFALQGVRNVPGRLRIKISRRRNDDEDAKVRLRPALPRLLRARFA